MALGQLALTPHEHRAVAGDDWRLGVNLWENGAVFDASGGTIKAALRDGNGFLVLDPVTQSSSTTGATWATGIVVVAFPAASTSAVAREAEYYLELQFTSTVGGLKKTWPWLPVLVSVAGITS